VSLHIFVEGGGDQQAGLKACRRAFGQLFEKFVPSGHLPRISACGGRGQAFDDFRTALRRTSEDRNILLLVDAEGSVDQQIGIWSYLKRRDNWDRPPSATDDDVCLMVQIMESWFLADPEKLEEYYGSDKFQRSALPRRQNIEEVSKDDVTMALDQATRNTQKGKYSDHKARDGFNILPMLDPLLIRAASVSFQRLFDRLSQV
jgi:hypothetical protein